MEKVAAITHWFKSYYKGAVWMMVLRETLPDYCY